jgi:hypothetical protein
LDLSRDADAELKIEPFLGKDAAARRVTFMGEGARLASHKVYEADKGSREALSVFKIPDITKLRYVSPHPIHGNHARATMVAVKMWGITSDSWHGWRAGTIGMRFTPISRPEGKPKAKPRKKGEPLPPPPDPVELQAVRELRPVFQDILKEFKVRFVFESYSNIYRTDFGFRDRRVGTSKADLINFSADRDMDKYGYRFLENEEIMVALLRWKLDAPVILSHVKAWATNHTLPAHHKGGSIGFRPSRVLFDRYLKGKKLRFSHPRPKGRTEMADFNKVGWKGEQGKKKAKK